jgi:hypothetical protein
MFRNLLLWAMTAACLFAAAPQSKSFQHPLVFEPNRGQFPEQVKWIARGTGYQLFLTSEGANFMLVEGSEPAHLPAVGPRPGLSPDALRTPVYRTVQMKLTAGRKWNTIQGLEPTGGVTNYLQGKDRSKWQTDVPHYSRVSISGVYEGIDLVFYANGRNLEYDFVVAPGADPKQIRLAFDGADRMQVDNKSGDLVLSTAGGVQLRHIRPKVYQQFGKRKVEVAGSYEILDRGQAAFTLAAYDAGRPLIIDPQVTYMKGFGADYGIPTDEEFQDIATGVVVGGAGNAWVTGFAFSNPFNVRTTAGNATGDNWFLTPKCTDPSVPRGMNGEVFVAKVAPDGALLALTLIGGCGLDMANDIAINATGAYITGFTGSPDFPQVKGFLPFRVADAFVLKLDPTLKNILYSTFLGGPDVDTASGIAVDGAGSAYVVGKTYTSGFPVVGAVQPNFGGVRDGFLAKLNLAGTGLVYSTYLGGSDFDEALAVAVDSTRNAYVTGQTFSSNFPTRGATQNYPNGPSAFVTKINPQGNAFVYSTYLGGGLDFGIAIAADAAGNAYVTGGTVSAAFPTTINAFQIFKPSTLEGTCGFFTKLSPAGGRLYSTYFSGFDGDTISRAIAVNKRGEVYLGGMTTTKSIFPGATSTWSQSMGSNGWVTKFSSQLNQLVYTFNPGSQVNAIAVRAVTSDTTSMEVYAAGWAHRLMTLNNRVDGFVIKLTEISGK